MATGGKDPGAFLTIGELSEELGVAQHILRYWETKFPQLKPLQRAGNRRYYRPGDVETAKRIHHLLSVEGYTVKGAQKALRQKPDKTNGAPPETERRPEPAPPPPAQFAHATAPPPPVEPEPEAGPSGIAPEKLANLRDRLVQALQN